MLNPIIYTVSNTEVKKAVRNWLEEETHLDIQDARKVIICIHRKGYTCFIRKKAQILQITMKKERPINNIC